MAITTASPWKPVWAAGSYLATPEKWVVGSFVGVWCLIVVLPLLLLIVYSFLHSNGIRVDWTFTTNNWIDLYTSGRWIVVLRTLRIGFTITIIELIVALPFALWLAKGCCSSVLKAMVLAAVTIPFFLDLSSRTMVWRSILGTEGPVNALLLHAGLIDHPLEWLLFGEFAVHFGMLGLYFPTMMLPIYMSLELVDDEYIEASYDLGGTFLQTVRLVILPLSLPGIVTGIVLTLVPIMADYVVPWLLGGFKVILLGNSVESALSALNYPIAAALSTVVVVILGGFLTILVVALRRLGLAVAPFAALRR